MKRLWIAAFVLSLGCVAYDADGTGGALTADGVTPADEVVCDDYSGRAFGICNAYCEAHDCDIEDHGGSDRSCDRLLSHFRDITGEDPPCLGNPNTPPGDPVGEPGDDPDREPDPNPNDLI